ncbi:glutathione S-transferase [Zestomonas thermotolerans]|uniref:glutathione S-transferase n=1 Tax=Zestomonas thermotolerans TaxID=157784 RepID=UPI0004853A47|nr:glutathione S-transferase [Pseudomonas thermotolerans]MBO2509437.1 glutathione S-transferase [Gammaproteobacteria bacterium]
MSTPGMTLFHSPTSPFVRKIMVLLHETGQLGRVAVETVQPAPTSPSEALNAVNPVGKVPALRLADGQVLYDSRVIFDYLDSQHVGEPLIPREGSARWRRLTLAALADAILEAAVLIRYETALRPADRQWPAWRDAQQGKIERALAELEEQALAELSCHFDVAAIGVACALGYLDLRLPALDWRARCPRLAAWYAETRRRPSLQATEPPAL